MKHNFKYYCKDYTNIENYYKAAADNFKGWHCHHRLQTWTSDGERRLVNISAAELIALDMYYNRPAEELIFLTESEHHSLHIKGKHHSEEAKKKIAEANKGKQLSEETRRRISEAHKNMSEETKNKMSEAHKGKPSGMKGKCHSEETRNKLSEANKGKHHSEEAKKKIAEAKKGNKYNLGKHWYNNGKISKRAYECPEGFVPGILRK